MNGDVSSMLTASAMLLFGLVIVKGVMIPFVLGLFHVRIRQGAPARK